MNLCDLQKEVWVWSRRNFGDQPAHRPLLGVVEECGELVDATERGCRADVADAVGDIMIFVADYCARRGFELNTVVGSWYDVRSFRGGLDDTFEGCVQSMLLHVSKVCRSQLKIEQGVRGAEDHVGQAKESLRAFVAAVCSAATLQGIDMEAAVDSTWRRVSKRDWAAKPLTGV